jgi:hypothetical protein
MSKRKQATVQPCTGWKSSCSSTPSHDDPNEPAIAKKDYFEHGRPAFGGVTKGGLKRSLSADKLVGQFSASSSIEQ